MRSVNQLSTLDYVVSLNGARRRKPGDPIQPPGDREFLGEHGSRLCNEMSRLGLEDGVVGVARPLSAENLAYLGISALSPSTLKIVLAELFEWHTRSYLRMRDFIERLDRLTAELKRLPALPATPEEMLAVHLRIFNPEERRDWGDQGFDLGELGEDLFDGRMRELGYSYKTQPWVMLTHGWPIDLIAQDWGWWELRARTLDDDDDGPFSLGSN